jgi:hypothetical protein
VEIRRLDTPVRPEFFRPEKGRQECLPPCLKLKNENKDSPMAVGFEIGAKWRRHPVAQVAADHA